MRIRFYNAKILTMESMDIIDGELWTDDDKISYVGKKPEHIPSFNREIDIKGDLLMPSFKDCHTHSAMTFLRSYADDLPLQDWLFKKVFPQEQKLTGERVELFARVALLEYLTSGITSCFDMYFYPGYFARLCAKYGFRGVLCGELTQGDDIETLEERYVNLNSFSPLVSYKLGMHSEYLCPIEMIRGVSELAHKYKAPVFMHNSETEKEVKECRERYSLSPTQLFDREGVFDYGGGGFHCVWLDDEDMRIFKERGLWAVTNPASNLKLASGIAPLQKMLDCGVGISIGTDGAASNNCLDMFREMYLAAALQKVKTGDAAACPADEVLKMATVNGAKTLGLDDCDVLAKGKQADIIEIDLHQPNMQPQHDIVKNIVYSGSKQNVKMTVCAGRILYRQGEFFVGEAPEDVYAAANEEVKRIIDG